MASNPNAKIAPLPFATSKLIFKEKSLSAFVEKTDCDHFGGVIGQEQVCTFELNSDGRRNLRPLFKRTLAMTIETEYTVNGVTQNIDGSYVNASITHRVAGRIGGYELACYPELFRDDRGEVIKDNIETNPKSCVDEDEEDAQPK